MRRVATIALLVLAVTGTSFATPRRSSMQPGFEKAHAAFRDHAAHALRASASALVVSPVSADAAVQLDARVCGAWAFVAYAKDQPKHDVRAWAVPDGTVITLEHHLGRLFVEAGVWEPKPRLDGAALAERLAWAMGMNHRVIGGAALALDAHGAGTLSFQIGYRPPGSGPRETITRYTVTLTADHQAHLAAAAAPAAKPRPSGIIGD